MTFFKVCQKVNKSEKIHSFLHSHHYKSRPRTFCDCILLSKIFFWWKKYAFRFTCNVKCRWDRNYISQLYPSVPNLQVFFIINIHSRMNVYIVSVTYIKELETKNKSKLFYEVSNKLCCQFEREWLFT